MEFFVSGYKSINKKGAIKVAPLTIICGANSSGKSSFMQPFLLIKQTLEAPFDPGTLLLDGPNVKITDFSQISCSKSSRKGVTIGYTKTGEAIFQITYQHSKSRGLYIKEQRVTRTEKVISLMQEGMAHEEIDNSLPDLPAFFKKILSEDDNQWSIVRERCFLNARIHSSQPSPAHQFFPEYAPMLNLGKTLERLIHVPGLRGNPERLYKTTAIEDKYPGSFDKYVASIILDWKKNKKSKLRAVSDDLRFLGLTSNVSAESLNDTEVELRVGRTTAHPSDDDLVNIADVGFGVSQVLPVLIALECAGPEQLVYIEQPELHLHPAAQNKLAHAFARAAKRGVQVIAETHSSIFLKGIQYLIASEKIDNNLVSLNWFSRDQDGYTRIEPASMDADGAFGSWPIDFDDVAIDAEIKYLEAVEKRHHE